MLNSYSSFSKMRMGPVELRMMRGCPPNKQKTVPASAVPRKLSITPFKSMEQKSNIVKHGAVFGKFLDWFKYMQSVRREPGNCR